MQPTSQAQFDDSMADRVPAADEVRPGIWSIPLPMQQPGNPFSLCYLIAGDDGSLHLIDTGYDGDENWAQFRRALDGFGLSLDDIASVFVTHLHPDHLGMTERLRAASGARIGMLRREHLGLAAVAAGGLTPPEGLLEGWGVPPERRAELSIPLGADLVARGIPTVDVTYEPGETLDVPGREIEVLWTPGHTAGSASLVDAAAGIVYTGDTVLPKIFSGLGLGDRGLPGSPPSTRSNPIADYLASLTSLARYDDFEVAPGHGYRFRGLIERNAQLAEHHLHRSRAAAAIIRDDPDATVWEVASRLRWTAGWQNLRSFYLLSALLQTVLHLDFARSPEYPG